MFLPVVVGRELQLAGVVKPLLRVGVWLSRRLSVGVWGECFGLPGFFELLHCKMGGASVAVPMLVSGREFRLAGAVELALAEAR